MSAIVAEGEPHGHGWVRLAGCGRGRDGTGGAGVALGGGVAVCRNFALSRKQSLKRVRAKIA